MAPTTQKSGKTATPKKKVEGHGHGHGGNQAASGGNQNQGGGSGQQQGTNYNNSNNPYSQNVRDGGASSQGVGSRVLILLEGKNVTPQGLMGQLQNETKILDIDDMNELSVESKLGTLVPKDLALPSAQITGISQSSTSDNTGSGKKKGTGRDGGTQGSEKIDMSEVITKYLTETETEMIFSVPSLCVALDDTENHTAVTNSNRQYEDLLNKKKASADGFRHQHAQTLNNAHKSKEILALPSSRESKASQVTEWDIADTFNYPKIPDDEQLELNCVGESEHIVQSALKKKGTLFTLTEKKEGDTADVGVGTENDLDNSGNNQGPGQGQQGAGQQLGGRGGGGLSSKKKHLEWLILEDHKFNEPAIIPMLNIVEKVAIQNMFHSQHMIYRNYPSLEELARAEEAWLKIGGLGANDGNNNGGLNSNENNDLSAVGSKLPSKQSVAPGDAGGGGAGGTTKGVMGAVAAKLNSKNMDLNNDIGDSDEESEDENNLENLEPELSDLLVFDAPQLTKRLSTTQAAFNEHRPDLLAVSYGDTCANLQTLAKNKDKDSTKGLILFWSLKNPSYPERIIKTQSGVASIAFSQAHPSIISAGLVDGNVAVWDSRKPTSQPVLMSGSSVSTHNDHKHTDCVFEVRWVSSSQSGALPGPGAAAGQNIPKSPGATGSAGASAGDLENLLSVSADGKIFSWTMRKGLEQKLLMNLKRVPNPNGSNAFRPQGAPIHAGSFRKAAGMSVDVLDSTSYLVATDDGLIHRCSTSHNEQYLDSFFGHSGTINRVRCNPWYPSLFLTCSVDWTIKLWSTKNNLIVQKSSDRDSNTVKNESQDQKSSNGNANGDSKDPKSSEGAATASATDANDSSSANQIQTLTLSNPLISTDLASGVQDICWHPSNSTSFAACCDDGRVEVWDLHKRSLDPIIVHHPKDLRGTDRTFVRFATNSPVLACGDSQGSVALMRLYRTDINYLSPQEQVDRLLNMIAVNENKK